MTDCAYTATIGPATPGEPPTGEVDVAPLPPGVALQGVAADSVLVSIHDDTGAPTNLPFHLMVAC